MSTILVVEDEPLVRMALCDFLQECGFALAQAATAAEAITILQSDRPAIDLVFSDLRLPGTMDGFGLARWIKANRPGLRVMLTSGGDPKAQAARAADLDVPFVAKPYDVHGLAGTIRELIDAPERARGDRAAVASASSLGLRPSSPARFTDY
ncbi:MAG TPA: response regulator [Alteraurantiacibacter sp.]